MRARILRLAALALALILAGSGAGAMAEDFRYDCRNDQVRIAIPADRLPDALRTLRGVTRCPISGTQLAVGRRSRPLAGRMTPERALRAMLRGTGLDVKSIRNGFQIVRAR